MAEYHNIIKHLGLEPHPEGGFFSETYRSSLVIEKEGLPSYYSGPRNVSTAIYYLLTKDEPISRLHKLQSDEMFHLYAGGPLEVLILHPDGRGEALTLGSDFIKGEKPQLLIPRETWFGAALKTGVEHTLIGATVSPGFDFKDFTMGVSADVKEDLKKTYPAHADRIERLLP
jgi:uncharacterized protein